MVPSCSIQLQLRFHHLDHGIVSRCPAPNYLLSTSSFWKLAGSCKMNEYDACERAIFHDISLCQAAIAIAIFDTE